MSYKSLCQACWRHVRWAIVFPVAPLVWWACTSHPLAQPTPLPQQQSTVYIPVSPVRQLDMVFMIDNSPSMAPKQAKLQAQFPNLINALQDPTTGNLPDLRVAIIDSDLGTDEAWTSGNCGPNAENGNSPWGDKGKFRMIGAASCGVTDPNALWLQAPIGSPANFTGNIATVFSCLAGNLGTQGCGEEHQLEAFEFALLGSSPSIGNANDIAMLRPSAYLGLVFLTDEDDCSAAGNDGMFGDSPGGSNLSNETASLRCSTRAYTCAGTGNLSDGTGTPTAPGYPSTTSFQAPWASCSPRTDYCSQPLDGETPIDVSVPTTCNPLRDLTRIANEVKSLKSDPNQILVAGIFGWPVGGDFTTAEPIKFAPRPNPNTADTAHPTLLDYWSLCYDPNHMPSPQTTDPTTGNDPTAWGWGAGPGLRESAFIDEFGANGMKFSICEADFTTALTQIGTTLAAKLQNLCVQYRLLDTDTTTPGLQPNCHVAYVIPDPVTGIPKEQSTGMPECDPTLSDAQQTNDPCWKLVYDTTKCPGAQGAGVGQLVNVVRKTGDPPLAAGTQIDMSCRTCVDGSTILACTDY